jgi:RNA polymerase sigma-70 factor (TIGR02960 family)
MMDGVDEAALLGEAKGGDDVAFGRLVDPYRAGVQAHCYRMLGSLHDAEDALQESLVRAWTSLGTFDGRGPIRPWLYRIATNRCLTHLEKRSRRELPADLTPGAPLTDVAWLEPYPDRLLGPEADVEQREGVELAFVAALQYLTASQRAVLVLREVLGFSAAEVADQLDTSVPAVNSALQRARRLLAERRPVVSQQATLRTLGDDTIKDLADRYAAAWHANDVDAIVAMLAEDATFSMPPLAEWFRGHHDIRGFLLSGPMPYRWRLVPCRANGQLAFASYWWEEERNAFVFVALDVLAVEERGITEVVAFLSRDLWKEFGLPMSFAGAPGCTG